MKKSLKKGLILRLHLALHVALDDLYDNYYRRDPEKILRDFKSLIEKNPDYNGKDEQGMTVLQLAIKIADNYHCSCPASLSRCQQLFINILIKIIKIYFE